MHNIHRDASRFAIDHELLLKLRKERGLTQAQVAQGANVSLSTYRRYESGLGRRSLALQRVDLYENLRDLCQFFELDSPQALLLAVDAPPAAPGPGSTALHDPPKPDSPFLVHRPLERAAHFYGREALLRTLFSFWQRAPLSSVALYGPLGSGKTSLLRQLQHLAARRGLRADQQARWLPPPGTPRFALLDFDEPRLKTQGGLLQELAARLNLPAAPRDLDELLLSVAAHLREPTVLLCDHLDAALTSRAVLGGLDDVLWAALRALLCNHSRGLLAVVITTRRPLRELLRAGGRASSLLALCRAQVVEPLDEAAARALLARSPLPFTEEDTRWLLEVSGRWPRQLQLCGEHRLRALYDDNPSWHESARRELALCHVPAAAHASPRRRHHARSTSAAPLRLSRAAHARCVATHR